MSRKYRQPGYDENNRKDRSQRERTPKKDKEGPRSPRMTGFRQTMRCALCGSQLTVAQMDIRTDSQCLRCGGDLHTCKNCVYFDTSSRFECTQPITERIGRKDIRNECTFFEARTTVEKEVSSAEKRPSDPREAFERLFRK